MSGAHDGIDDGVLGAPPPPDADRRVHGVGSNVARGPWPPPSRGPLPPAESIPPDLNIATAQDEIDAWAHEHDRASNMLSALRRLLHGEPEEPAVEGVEEEFARKRARFRRVARASPTEKGRRTSEDISEEVTEQLISDGVWRRRDRLRNEAEDALGRLFRAKDNIARLDAYVRSLPRVDNQP